MTDGPAVVSVKAPGGVVVGVELLYLEKFEPSIDFNNTGEVPDILSVNDLEYSLSVNIPGSAYDIFIGEIGSWSSGDGIKIREWQGLSSPRSVDKSDLPLCFSNQINQNHGGYYIGLVPSSEGVHRLRLEAKGITIFDKDITIIDVDMVPDYNRDGIITDADRGMVSDTDPWRFWINDDDDDGTIQTTGDKPLIIGYNNYFVDGMRDLVDFFPLYLT